MILILASLYLFVASLSGKMTKRRPKNKKPTGLNRSLGNCLLNERENLRQQYRERQQVYNAENMVEINKVKLIQMLFYDV